MKIDVHISQSNIVIDGYGTEYPDYTTEVIFSTWHTGPAGADGADGADGNGITDISKTATSGNVDTYTITFSDGTTTTFNVTNGEDGEAGPQGPQGPSGATGATGPQGPQGPAGANGTNGTNGVGIASVTKTSTSGLTDTYTITFTDGTTTTYNVVNGADGNDGAQGEQGPQGPQGPEGPQGPQGATGATGETGAQGPQGPAGPTGETGPAGADGDVDMTYEDKGSVSGSVSVTFAASTSCYTVMSAAAAINIALTVNNTAANYILVKNTGSSDIAVTIASVNSLSSSNIHVPADGITVAAGKYTEIGVYANASVAVITASGKLN